MQLNPTQNLAVDLLILSFDRENNSVKIFTPTREDSNKKALPGVLLKTNESISKAVKRTIDTKTILSDLKYRLQELPAQTNPNRDPRGHVVSIPILIFLMEPFALSENWSNFEPDLELDFDHTRMVNIAFNILAQNWDRHPLPLLLTGNTTTLEETRDLLAHFQPYYTKTLPSNLRQMSFVQNFLKETNSFMVSNKKGRPPRCYKVLANEIKPLYQ
jgi:mutT/nudix family hydrolase